MVDYTNSDSHEIHNGKRMHEMLKPVPTVVSGTDMNSIVWELMEVLKKAGISGKEFNKSNPDTYTQILQAMEVLFLTTKARYLPDADNCLKTGHYRCLNNHGHGASDATVVVFDDGGNERYQLSFNSSSLKVRSQADYASGTWRTWRAISFDGHEHLWAEITGKPSKFPASIHNHDDRYLKKYASKIGFNEGNSENFDGIEYDESNNIFDLLADSPPGTAGHHSNAILRAKRLHLAGAIYLSGGYDGLELDKTNNIIDFITNSPPGTAGHHSNAILRAKRLHLAGAIYLSGGYDGIEFDEANNIFDFLADSPPGTAGHHSNAILRAKEIFLPGHNLGVNGTIPLPNGFYLQYGRGTASSVGENVVFATAFKTECLLVLPGEYSGGSPGDVPSAFGIYAQTKYGFKFKVNGPDEAGSYIAIGR